MNKDSAAGLLILIAFCFSKPVVFVVSVQAPTPLEHPEVNYTLGKQRTISEFPRRHLKPNAALELGSATSNDRWLLGDWNSIEDSAAGIEQVMSIPAATAPSAIVALVNAVWSTPEAGSTDPESDADSEEAGMEEESSNTFSESDARQSIREEGANQEGEGTDVANANDDATSRAGNQSSESKKQGTKADAKASGDKTAADKKKKKGEGETSQSGKVVAAAKTGGNTNSKTSNAVEGGTVDVAKTNSGVKVSITNGGGKAICSDGTPTNKACSAYANDFFSCDGSKTCCQLAKESAGRRRDWAGDAYDNCKLSCGICEAGKEMENFAQKKSKGGDSTPTIQGEAISTERTLGHLAGKSTTDEDTAGDDANTRVEKSKSGKSQSTKSKSEQSSTDEDTADSDGKGDKKNNGSENDGETTVETNAGVNKKSPKNLATTGTGIPPGAGNGCSCSCDPMPCTCTCVSQSASEATQGLPMVMPNAQGLQMPGPGRIAAGPGAAVSSVYILPAPPPETYRRTRRTSERARRTENELVEGETAGNANINANENQPVQQANPEAEENLPIVSNAPQEGRNGRAAADEAGGRQDKTRTGEAAGQNGRASLHEAGGRKGRVSADETRKPTPIGAKLATARARSATAALAATALPDAVPAPNPSAASKAMPAIRGNFSTQATRFRAHTRRAPKIFRRVKRRARKLASFPLRLAGGVNQIEQHASSATDCIQPSKDFSAADIRSCGYPEVVSIAATEGYHFPEWFSGERSHVPREVLNSSAACQALCAMRKKDHGGCDFFAYQLQHSSVHSCYMKKAVSKFSCNAYRDWPSCNGYCAAGPAECESSCLKTGQLFAARDAQCPEQVNIVSIVSTGKGLFPAWFHGEKVEETTKNFNSGKLCQSMCSRRNDLYHDCDFFSYALDSTHHHTCFFIKHFDNAACNKYINGCVATGTCLVGLSGPVHCGTAVAHLAAMQGMATAKASNA